MRFLKGFLIGLVAVVLVAVVALYFLGQSQTTALKKELDDHLSKYKQYVDLKYDVAVSPITVSVKATNIKAKIKGVEDIQIDADSIVFGGLFSKSLVIYNIKVNTPQAKPIVTIDDISTTDIQQKENVTTKCNMKFNNISLNPESLPPAQRKQLVEFIGTDKLSFNLYINFDLNVGSKKCYYKLALEAKNLGELDFIFNLSNIDYKKFIAFQDMDPNDVKKMAELMKVINEVAIDGMEIIYKDTSLADKLLKKSAAMMGKDVNTLKNEAVKQLDGLKAMTVMFPMLPKNTSDMIDEVKKFIKSPKELQIMVTPTKPMPIGALATIDKNPEKLLELLAFKVVAK